MSPLISQREVVVPSLKARLATSALLHPRARIHAIANDGVICEDAVLVRSFERLGRTTRPIVTVLLEGAARIRVGDESKWLAPGDVLGMPEKGPIVMRQEGPRYRAIALEWDPEFLGPRPSPFWCATLADEARTEVNEIHAALASGSVSDATAIDLVRLIARAGLPLEARSSAEWHHEPTKQARALSPVLDRLFSNLVEQPMMADLEAELGLTARQLNRVVASFNATYGFNAEGWRDARGRRRLFVGVALMTAEGASAEGVARAIGYRSGAAFTTALTEAGLPAPSTIKRSILDLRAP